MKRFKHLLCVVTTPDTGAGLLERAVELAEVNQARLSVVTVAERVSIGMGMPEGGPISGGLQVAVVDSARKRLENAIAPFRKRREINGRVLVGSLFLEVIREVLRNGHDLVIKSAEDPEWLDRLLGSEDMHLLRKCPCPVWLIKPGAPQKYRSVLAAVDLDDAHGQEELQTRRRLNLDILELASSLALANFSELHVVHAWEVMGETSMRDGFVRLSEAKVDAYVHQVRQRRESDMAQLLEELNDRPGNGVLDCIEYEVHLVKGSPRKHIPAVARAVRADMVVMGTVARTGVPGFITGNTAEMILSQIESSVLAIKPPGFTTPVTLDAGDD
jgi:nucleotide-binding universal stress UspA family protein